MDLKDLMNVPNCDMIASGLRVLLTDFVSLVVTLIDVHMHIIWYQAHSYDIHQNHKVHFSVGWGHRVILHVQSALYRHQWSSSAPKHAINWHIG